MKESLDERIDASEAEHSAEAIEHDADSLGNETGSEAPGVAFGEEAAEPELSESAPTESAGEAFASGEEVGAEGAYKAYGELLEQEMAPEKFAELEAMEELLANDGEYASLPHPDIFNAYPPEVQRKIMEWTDRDVKARRDDESRRKDELVRATIERDRRRQSIPAIIMLVAILCAAVVGFATGNAWFAVAFLLVPIFVIVAVFVTHNIDSTRGARYRKPPKM